VIIFTSIVSTASFSSSVGDLDREAAASSSFHRDLDHALFMILGIDLRGWIGAETYPGASSRNDVVCPPLYASSTYSR